MPVYNKKIPSLTGGVSQQPDSIRFDNQGLLQDNFYTSASKGIVKRFPTEFAGEELNVTDGSEGTLFKTVELPNGESFIIYGSYNDGIYSYNVRTKTHNLLVDNSGHFEYFRIPVSEPNRDPNSAYKFLTVGDGFLMLNSKTQFVVGYDPTPDSEPPRRDKLKESLVWVRQGNFGKTYRVSVDIGTSQFWASDTQADGSSSSHTQLVDTSNIANRLATRLQTEINNLGIQSEVSIDQRGNLIFIKDTRGELNTEKFEVTTTDGFDDTAMYAINNEINLFSELPPHAPTDFYVKVKGSSDTNFSAIGYWVKSNGDPDHSDAGTFPQSEWGETLAVEIGNFRKLEGQSMPYYFVYNSLTSQIELSDTFNGGVYDDKEVGPLDLSTPSFVRSFIKDMFFWKGRIGFITETSVTLSESGNIFNFFPTSFATSLAADPVDVEINLQNSSSLEFAVPWQEQVILFGDKTQAILRSEGATTNSTVSISEATNFEINKDVKPTLSGSSVFFPLNNNNNSEVREYFLINLANQKDASNITSHIPRYLPKGIATFRESPNGKVVVAHSKIESNSLYLYNYLWQGETKVISAWNRYEIAGVDEIEGFDFIDEDMWIGVRESGSKLKFIKMKLTDSYSEESNGRFVVHLDLRVNSGDLPVVDNGDGTFTYTLPYSVEDTENYIAVSFSDNTRYGGELVSEFISPTEIKVTHPSGEDVVMGYKFTSRFRLGTISIKESNVALTAGRTHILNLLVNYADTVEFSIEKTIKGRQTTKSDYHGRRKGAINNIFGQIDPDDGVLRVPVNAKNDTVTIDIVVDSHLPASFQFIDAVLRYWSIFGQRTS